MTIELAGIELFGFHGVLEAERTQGQRFLVDLDLTLDGEAATAAAASDRIVALGRPVLVGVSRKSTLARVLGDDGPVGTDAASVGAAVAAFDRGATVLRVHDVRPHVEALAAAAAVERGSIVV